MARAVLCALLTLATLGAGTAPAQDAAGTPAPSAPEASAIFLDTVDVDLVNVDVYVTDRKGNPVSGLTLEDFEIFEDDRPVAVTNFFAVEAGRPRVQGAGAAPPAEGPLAEVELPAIPLDQRLHVVLFIDDLNISPSQRNRVLASLRRFVGESLQPADLAMVVRFNGSVELVQGLTADRRQLLSALDEVAGGGSMGAAQADIERRTLLSQIQEAELPVAGGGQSLSQGASFAVSEAMGLHSQIELYAQRHQTQSFNTLRALSGFVTSMAGFAGRKAVVYVSEGLSLRPGETLYRAWENKFSGLERHGALTGTERGRMMSKVSGIATSGAELNIITAVRELGKLANTNRVTFYGLRADSLFAVSAQDGQFDLGGLDTPGGGQAWSAELTAIESANRGGSMQILAEATGGFAVVNSIGFDVALDRLQRDFESYYSLGYTPDRPRDDRSHRIVVWVRDRSLKVRHRENHRDKSREQQMQDLTLAALVHEQADNPLGVAVDVAPPQHGAKGHQMVPVMVRIPITNLVLLPRGELYEGQVSIHVGARDEDGHTSPIRTVRVPIRIPKSELPRVAGLTAGHRFMLEMRPGEHVVAVGVRDEVGGVESTTLVTPSVPEEG